VEEKLTPKEFLHVCRNPTEYSITERRIARETLCDAYEILKKALRNPVIVQCRTCSFIEKHNNQPDFFCSRCGGKEFDYKR